MSARPPQIQAPGQERLQSRPWLLHDWHVWASAQDRRRQERWVRRQQVSPWRDWRALAFPRAFRRPVQRQPVRRRQVRAPRYRPHHVHRGVGVSASAFRARRRRHRRSMRQQPVHSRRLLRLRGLLQARLQHHRRDRAGDDRHDGHDGCAVLRLLRRFRYGVREALWVRAVRGVRAVRFRCRPQKVLGPLLLRLPRGDHDGHGDDDGAVRHHHRHGLHGAARCAFRGLLLRYRLRPRQCRHHRLHRRAALRIWA